MFELYNSKIVYNKEMYNLVYTSLGCLLKRHSVWSKLQQNSTTWVPESASGDLHHEITQIRRERSPTCLQLCASAAAPITLSELSRCLLPSHSVAPGLASVTALSSSSSDGV